MSNEDVARLERVKKARLKLEKRTALLAHDANDVFWSSQNTPDFWVSLKPWLVFVGLAGLVVAAILMRGTQ